MNQTVLRFGYPSSLISEYEHWVVLIRPKQITAGCVVLACKEPAEALPNISVPAIQELPQVATDLEVALADAVRFEKINYLMLMMVDPHVHFHVIPRYSDVREFAGFRFPDHSWPGPPDIRTAADVPAETVSAIQREIIARWPNPPQDD